MSIFVVSVEVCAMILAKYRPWQRRYSIYDNGYLFVFHSRKTENDCVQLLKDRRAFFQSFNYNTTDEYLQVTSFLYFAFVNEKIAIACSFTNGLISYDCFPQGNHAYSFVFS